MIDPTEKQGHFLNEEQKKVKQKIMEDCLDGLFKNLADNHLIFNDMQQVSDLIFSILVMFNREVLVHFIRILDIPNQRKVIMKELFETIKDQVNKQFKQVLN